MTLNKSIHPILTSKCHLFEYTHSPLTLHHVTVPYAAAITNISHPSPSQILLTHLASRVSFPFYSYLACSLPSYGGVFAGIGVGVEESWEEGKVKIKLVLGGAGTGVGALPLLAVPEVPRGPFPLYHCRLVLVRSSSCHPVPFGASCYLRSVGGLSRDSTAPVLVSDVHLRDGVFFTFLSSSALGDEDIFSFAHMCALSRVLGSWRCLDRYWARREIVGG